MNILNRRKTVGARENRELEWHLTAKKEKKKIAVIGISRGAGSTFLSVSLAFLFSMSKNVESVERILPADVTLIEMRPLEQDEPALYYSAALDRRFRERRFTDVFSLILKGQSVPQTVNLHKGIHWVVQKTPRNHSEELCCFSQMAAEFPLEQMPGSYIIADSPPLDSLHRYDLVIAVIDPLPSAVYAGAQRYESLRDMEESGLPVMWVINKDNESVNHSALKRFLKLQDYVCLPLLQMGPIYQAEYEGKLPVELAEGKLNVFMGAVQRRLEQISGESGIPSNCTE